VATSDAVEDCNDVAPEATEKSCRVRWSDDLFEKRKDRERNINCKNLAKNKKNGEFDLARVDAMLMDLSKDSEEEHRTMEIDEEFGSISVEKPNLPQPERWLDLGEISQVDGAMVRSFIGSLAEDQVSWEAMMNEQ